MRRPPPAPIIPPTKWELDEKIKEKKGELQRYKEFIDAKKPAEILPCFQTWYEHLQAELKKLEEDRNEISPYTKEEWDQRINEKEIEMQKHEKWIEGRFEVFLTRDFDQNFKMVIRAFMDFQNFRKKMKFLWPGAGTTEFSFRIFAHKNTFRIINKGIYTFNLNLF